MGRMLGVVDSSMCRANVNFDYTAALVTQKFYVESAPNGRCVVDIRGIPRVAGSGGACTLQIFKVPDGVAVASGTLLHSGSYNLVGTADFQQVLTLIPDPTGTALCLKAGDALGYVLTGTATSAVGTITVTTEPT